MTADRPLRWDGPTSTVLTERFLAAEREEVDDGCSLVCSSAVECRRSVGSKRLVEGQLSWVGACYGLVDDVGPLRILVVPKQTGRGGDGHSHVTHEQRAAQVHGAKHGGIGEHRTHHMAGTEAALEVLLGAVPGSRHVHVAHRGRVHVFDCFAMVNATRCSKVDPHGGVDGQGSAAMFDHCQRHLASAIDALSPTSIVCEGMAQGRSPARSVRSVMDTATGTAPLYVGTRNESEMVVVELTHPSRNWTSYLDPRFRASVKPLLKAAIGKRAGPR